VKRKKCNWCGLEKDVEEFSKRSVAKDGRDFTCKQCRTDSRDKEYLRKYNKTNSVALREKKKQYYKKNPEKHKLLKAHRLQYNREKMSEWTRRYWNIPENRNRRIENNKIRRKRPLVKKMLSKNNKKYCKKPEVRAKINLQYSKNYYGNVGFRLNKIMSNHIRQCLKGKKMGVHWGNFVPYTVDELKVHLEKQFRDGMSWSNHGIHGWHIDHIIPKSKFNITNYQCDDFKKCWDLINLQPLWWWENLEKGSSFNC